MKLLQSVQRQFALMGVNRQQLTQKYRINHKYAESFFNTSTDVLVTLCYANVVFRVDGFFLFIDSCTDIVAGRLGRPVSKAIYDEFSQLIEKWSDITSLALAKGTPICLILPKSLVSFALYFTTDSADKSFLLPLPMWFPFDSNNLIGYSCNIALQCVMTAKVFWYVGSITSCGISAFLFVVSSCRDAKSNLNLIDKMAKSKRHRAECMEHVFAFIQHHSKMKELIRNFSNFWQPIFMTLFPWSLVNVCATMLMFQIQLTRGALQFEVLMLILAYAIYAFGMIFLVCELCQRASDEFEEICDMIGQFHWYSFPDKLKQLLPTIMIVAQEPVGIDCFGSVKCTRDSFKRVVNGGFSYFMVIRQVFEMK